MSIQAYSQVCPDNLDSAPNMPAVTLLKCSFICSKDSDCIEFYSCADPYSVNKKYKEKIAAYIDQFYIKRCERHNIAYASNTQEKICFAPKCHKNKCVRQSISCEERIKIDTAPRLEISNNQISWITNQMSQNLFSPYNRPIGDQNCYVGVDQLSSPEFIKNLRPNDPNLKIQIVLKYAEDVLNKNKDSFSNLCASIYLAEIIQKDRIDEIKDTKLLNGIRAYYMSFFKKSDTELKEIINSNYLQLAELQNFGVQYSDDLELLKSLPSKLISTAFKNRRDSKWTKESAEFYIQYLVLNESLNFFPSFTLNPISKWLEINPVFYREKVIPLLKSSGIAMEGRPVNSRLISTEFITKIILNNNGNDLVAYFSEVGEDPIKCQLAKAAFNHYTASDPQQKMKFLKESKSACVRDAFQNIERLERKIVNGCPDFNLNGVGLTNEHLEQLNLEKQECKLTCQNNKDCTVVKGSCDSFMPVNLIFKQELERDLKTQNVTCEIKTDSAPPKIECINSLCIENTNYCKSENFYQAISKYIFESNMNNCKSDDDCEVYATHNLSLLKPQKYAIRKGEKIKSQISLYILDKYTKCERQNEPLEKNNNFIFKRGYRKDQARCEKNICIYVAPDENEQRP